MRLRVQLIGPLEDHDDIAGVSRVVNGVEDGWHDWVDPDPGDERLARYYDQNPTHWELIAKSYTAAFAYGRPGVRTVTIAVHGVAARENDGWSLQDAVSYLSQPLEVLVENRRNDGRFFTACWDAVAPGLAARLRAHRPAAVFGQGGGKAEVLELIQYRVKEAQDAGTVPPRLFVLLDSDARYPGDVTKESRLLRETCGALGIPISLLRKRAIENYIGDERLREYGGMYLDLQPSVTFLLSLTPEQRDHYPMKKGMEIRNGVPTNVSDAEQELYAGAGVAWPNGFRPKLTRLMDYVLRQDVPVAKADLEDRGAVDEFKVLAARLDEEI